MPPRPMGQTQHLGNLNMANFGKGNPKNSLFSPVLSGMARTNGSPSYSGRKVRIAGNSATKSKPSLATVVSLGSLQARQSHQNQKSGKPQIVRLKKKPSPPIDPLINNLYTNQPNVVLRSPNSPEPTFTNLTSPRSEPANIIMIK